MKSNNEKIHHNDKLTQKDKEDIKEQYKQGTSRKDLAEKFNVTVPTIWYHTQKNKKHAKTPKENLGYTGKGKKIIRDHMLWLCNREYKKNPLTAILEFFGLGELFYFLLENTKAKIKSIDCDDNIGKKLKNIPFTEYATFQKICQQNEEYKIVFLDYCGDLTKDAEKDISMAPNIMMDESILCMTLCMRTGKYTKNTSRETMELDYITTVIQILATRNISAKLNFVVKYAGQRIDPLTGKSNNKYPMKFYQFACKRVSNINKTIDEMSGDEAKALLKEYHTRPQFITPERLKEMDEEEQTMLQMQEKIL